VLGIEILYIGKKGMFTKEEFLEIVRVVDREMKRKAE
jgi:hypothetical protein